MLASVMFTFLAAGTSMVGAVPPPLIDDEYSSHTNTLSTRAINAICAPFKGSPDFDDPAHGTTNYTATTNDKVFKQAIEWACDGRATNVPGYSSVSYTRSKWELYPPHSFSMTFRNNRRSLPAWDFKYKLHADDADSPQEWVFRMGTTTDNGLPIDPKDFDDKTRDKCKKAFRRIVKDCVKREKDPLRSGGVWNKNYAFYLFSPNVPSTFSEYVPISVS